MNVVTRCARKSARRCGDLSLASFKKAAHRSYRRDVHAKLAAVADGREDAVDAEFHPPHLVTSREVD